MAPSANTPNKAKMNEPKSRSYKLGWWPQGGWLDWLDVKLSMPVFTLDLGPLEWLMVIPGTFNGMPITAWGVLPLWVGSTVAEPTADKRWAMLRVALGCGAPLVAALATEFYLLLKDDYRKIFYWTRPLLPFLAVVPGLLTRFCFGERAGHVVSLLLCSWFATQTLNHFVKISARRMRPGVSLASELAHVKRRFPVIQQITLEGSTAFESFPSGDAAGAMVMTKILLELGMGPLSWLPFALGSFGRMYFLAHHVSDCLVGGAIGWYVTKAMVQLAGLDGGMGIPHTVAGLTLFAVFHRVAARKLSFAVPAEFRVEKSVYVVDGDLPPLDARKAH